MIDRYLIVHVLLIIVSGVLSGFVCLCSPFMNRLAATIECGKYICCRQLSCPSVECWCGGSIRRYTRLESDDEERFSSAMQYSANCQALQSRIGIVGAVATIIVTLRTYQLELKQAMRE